MHFVTQCTAVLLTGTLYPLCPLMHTYLLTYSMVQSPWEAKRFAASQEIPRISRNLKVHYRTHKRPPPVPILGQPNPVHIPTSHLLEIHPNIIHPSTPRSLHWSLSLRFPHQDPIHSPLVTHTRHKPGLPCGSISGEHNSYLPGNLSQYLLTHIYLFIYLCFDPCSSLPRKNVN